MADTKFGSDFLGDDSALPAIDGAEAKSARIDWATESVDMGALERHRSGPEASHANDTQLLVGDAPIAIERPQTSRDRRYSSSRDITGPTVHDRTTRDMASPATCELSVQREVIDDAIEVDVSSLQIEDEPKTEQAVTDVLALADEAAAMETTILAAGAIPPERVRFTAPLEIMVEGDSDLYRGAVLNLSSSGLACAMPLELTPGQRVWVRFKLGLAEEPLSLLCAVIWRRDANPEHVLYGLQFTSLADDEASRIGTTVRERLEGRAADWPLPLIPTGEPVRANMRKAASSWTSAAFGMIGGMALALALSALPHLGSNLDEDEELPLPVASAPVIEEPMQPQPTPMNFGAQAPELVAIDVGAPDAIAGAVQPLDGAAAKPVVAAAGPVKPEASKPEVAKADNVMPAAKVDVAKAEPAKAVAAVSPAQQAKLEAKLAKDPPNGGLLPRKTSGSSAEVTLASGSSAFKAHAFWLDNPRRYVVDVPGKLSGKTPEGNPLVSRVRVGSYDDKTRYVLEVASNVHDARVESRGNALVVTLSK